jgi:3-phenylpropionate/trans-cinnamate dioxygenase ferredoxin reductase component
METVADWERKFRKGVIYYLKERRVQGVLPWNTWGLVDAARDLIASRQVQPADLLMGRLRERG